MLKSESHRMVMAGLFTAIGLILPFFTAHAFGIPGTILLPMHIPVLLCGLICGPRYGAVCGAVVPAMSSLLTGMPAAYPMLPIMIVQLFAMGIISGLLYQKIKLRIYFSLLISMLSGWLLYGFMYTVLMFSGNGDIQALSLSAALMQGFPGIVIQIVLVPVIMYMLRRYGNWPAHKNYKARLRVGTDDMLEEALRLIGSGSISCVVIQNNTIVHTADGRGVTPLLELYDDDPEKLKNAFVVDKIVGKAAAMIMVISGVRKVYGRTMSVAAENYLKSYVVETRYGRCVDVISNRDKNGICPIERSVIDIDDPQEGVESIKNTVKTLVKYVI